jgi:hypothetical protein
MQTWLLPWNPDDHTFPWLDIQNDILQIRQTGFCLKGYACGNTTGIQPGDRVFIIHLGISFVGMPRGIMSSGWAASDVKHNSHLEPELASFRRGVNYLNLYFDVIINPRTTKRFLLLDRLKLLFPDQTWSLNNAGIVLPPLTATALEKTWAELLGRIPLSQHSSYTEIKRLAAQLDYPTEPDFNETEDDEEDETSGDTTNTGATHEPIPPPEPESDNLLTTVQADLAAADLENSDPESPGFPEGQKTTALVNKYERDARNRADAIQIHGTTCQACDFNFEQFYGPHGQDYIEVHHLRPISTYNGPVIINPTIDMAVLCANCHRMIHRHQNAPLTLDELRQHILQTKS